MHCHNLPSWLLEFVVVSHASNAADRFAVALNRHDQFADCHCIVIHRDWRADAYAKRLPAVVPRQRFVQIARSFPFWFHDHARGFISLRSIRTFGVVHRLEDR